MSNLQSKMKIERTWKTLELFWHENQMVVHEIINERMKIPKYEFLRVEENMRLQKKVWTNFQLIITNSALESPCGTCIYYSLFMNAAVCKSKAFSFLVLIMKQNAFHVQIPLNKFSSTKGKSSMNEHICNLNVDQLVLLFHLEFAFTNFTCNNLWLPLFLISIFSLAIVGALSCRNANWSLFYCFCIDLSLLLW